MSLEESAYSLRMTDRSSRVRGMTIDDRPAIGASRESPTRPSIRKAEN